MRVRLGIRHLASGLCSLLLAASVACAADLRIALRDDPDVLDPTLATTYTGRIVFGGLCDKLFDIDQRLAIVPQLSTGYEWSDPQTLIIHLRQGVKFHDGTVMDAAAVKLSLERHLTLEGSFRRPELNQIERIEEMGKDAVRIVLKTPSSPFLSQLTDRAGMILAPEAAKTGKNFGLKPVCSGPFRFVERVPQDHITLERFPDYWNPSVIHFDRVIYRPMTDPSVRLANLKAGAIDIADYIVPTDAKAVESDPRLRLVVSDALGYGALINNLANGPRANTPYGKDARVRKAFELAIDRVALIDVVFNGVYPASAQAVPPTSPYHVASVVPGGRDVARAKALLKEAGVTTPLTVELLVINGPDTVQVAEVIQSMAAEAGFNVKIRAMEARALLNAEIQGDFEAALGGWSGRTDPDGNTYSFLRTGGPLNEGHYSNPALDALLEQARQVTDVPARVGLYEKVWAIQGRDLPITYLWTGKNLAGMTVKMKGFVPVADGMM